MTTCVFVGPTLAAAEAAEILDATFLPPVKLGDVYRSVARLRPRAIGIVDGYFQWIPSVWHKEILWAMDEGVRVFGAASMGALRAAELAPFGMHGVGRVFEAYRDGRLHGPDECVFEDDDEVAVVHGPAENGYVAASDAMVNIRCTLARAAAEGIIAEETRRVLVAAAKADFFPDRSYASLLVKGRANGLPGHELTQLKRWLPHGRLDQKRLDAVALLETMRDFIATDTPPTRSEFTFERTTYWERAEAALRGAAGPGTRTLMAALRLDPGSCEHLGEQELRDWYFGQVVGAPVPADLVGWVSEAGYAGLTEFHVSAFAAYLGWAPDPGGAP